MHLTIVDANAYVASVRTGERALLHAVHDTLNDGRDEAGVDSTTDDTVVDNELATPVEIHLLLVLDVHLELLVAELVGVGLRHSLAVRLDDEVYLTKLTRTT